jgi:hypothetical protein
MEENEIKDSSSTSSVEQPKVTPKESTEKEHKNKEHVNKSNKKESNKKKAKESTALDPKNYSILFSLITNKHEKELVKFLHSQTKLILGVFQGEGTAKNSVYEVLQIASSSYNIYMSLVPKATEKEILDNLYKRFYVKNASGLAFTIRLEGYTGLNTLVSILGGKNNVK